VDWEPVRANRRVWDRISSWYQDTHDPQIGRQAKLWGAWSVPESELGALGPTAGLRALELGCGGAQWAAALEADGAVVVGLDLSAGQLRAAQARAPDLRLVHAAAETLPFRSETFDLVFCDHGALSWSDPTYTIPEATRVLVAGGRLIFNTTSPWLRVCYDDSSDRITADLYRSYFDLGALDEGDGAKTYTLTYGAWIRVFRDNGLVIEDLIEPRPARDASSGYFTCDPADWANRWPGETLWVAQKTE
jgi:ubiquinone/menaquinone biosynthesis C-methylase UbiE